MAHVHLYYSSNKLNFHPYRRDEKIEILPRQRDSWHFHEEAAEQYASD